MSTPKSADKEKETKTDETVVQNAAEKAIMEEKSGLLPSKIPLPGSVVVPPILNGI